MNRTIWVALGLLIATAAPGVLAASFDDCHGVTTASHVTFRSVGPDQCLGWNVSSSDSGGTESQTIQVRAAAKVCVVPNKASTGPDTLTMDILFLPRGDRAVCSGGSAECFEDSECPGVETCGSPTAFSILDTPLDGTPGAGGTQNVCKDVDRGHYRCRVGTPAGAGDLGACVVQGLES